MKRRRMLSPSENTMSFDPGKRDKASLIGLGKTICPREDNAVTSVISAIVFVSFPDKIFLLHYHTITSNYQPNRKKYNMIFMPCLVK